MRIANQPFIAPAVKNTTNVKPEDKLGADKTNGTKEMSQADEMAAFKKDFYNELAKIAPHSTVSNRAVNISDSAFKAMMEDPSYKDKVLSLIKRDCQSSYGSRNCSLSITVGATLNEYRADSWPVGYDSEFGIRTQNSFFKSSDKKADDEEILQARYAESRLSAMKFQQMPKSDIAQAEVSDEAWIAAVKGNIASELKTAILDEDFLAQMKDLREQRPQFEENGDKIVDPDGKIAALTYVESVVRQYEKARNTISEYYSRAHQDNLSRGSQIDALNYLSVKYTPFGLAINSPYYRSDMSEAERSMSHRQESALILGGSLTMKDPYALASSGGVLNIEEVDKIAQQAVRDKLDALWAEWNQNNI